MPCRGYGAFAIHDKEISVRSMFAACSLERKERDMQYIVTAQEMKKYESFAMERIGIPPLLLMERAAMEMRDVLMRYVREKSRILVFAGTGNNGGDALAVGRLLAEKGAEVSFYMPGNRRRVSAETRKQLSILRNLGFAVFSKLPEAEYDIVIDGLFGIGLSRDIEGVYESAVEEIARFRAKGALVASVDIPSGISADSGKALGRCVYADLTVTFEYAKAGHYLYPGKVAAGRLFIRRIGLDGRALKEAGLPSFFTYPGKELQNRLPVRNPAGHKGSFGRVLLIAGSRGMAGAAILCGRSIFRTGAGMVKIITPDSNREILQTTLPEAMVDSYGEMPNLDGARKALSWADVVVAGPGMGQGEDAKALLYQVLAGECGDGREGERALVLDADALNLIAGSQKLQEAVCSYKKGRMIMTPHPGEFARLSGLTMEEYGRDRKRAVQSLARRFGCVIVGKDAVTLAAAPEEGPVFLNLSGNDGMAVAGSGDVLAGVIGGLLAQGLPPYEAACAGVCLHGYGGDAAARARSRYGVMASDIIEGVMDVICRVKEV